jgi:hypothetical protein
MSEVRPAFQGEMMLAGWTQSHTSGCKVSFWINDEDLEAFKHLTVRKGRTAGQRFMAVLVQIGDDEQPINPGEDRAEKPRNALTLSAVSVGNNPAFQEFVGTIRNWFPNEAKDRQDQAADYIREFCRIESRKELDTSPTAAQLFARLMGEYRDWCRSTGVQS